MKKGVIRLQHNSLAYKAIFSASVGLPISWTINVTVLPVLNGMIHENVLLAGFFLALPFLAVSALRIYIIDWFYKNRKKIKIDLH